MFYTVRLLSTIFHQKFWQYYPSTLYVHFCVYGRMSVPRGTIA